MNRPCAKPRLRLDLAEERLWNGERVVDLSPKLFCLIRHLVLHPDRLLTKQEILSQVWPNTYVTEGSVKDTVKILRRVLNDDPKRPEMIETVRGRGYRYLGGIEVLGASTLPSTAAQPVARPSIAVLPFENLSGDSAQEYFVDGLTEDVITELSRFRDLFIIARHSTFTYKNRQVRIQDVGRELGARYVMEGSIQKSSRILRISAQLLEAQIGRHLWARRYDCELKDVFDIRDDVTQSIAATLLGDGGQLMRSEIGRSLAKNTARLDAYDYLLRGIEQLYRFTKESTSLARHYFENAAKLDLTYSEAYSSVECTYSMEVEYGWSSDSRGSLEQACHLAHKAVALDDSNYHNYWH